MEGKRGIEIGEREVMVLREGRVRRRGGEGSMGGWAGRIGMKD